jgi:hypothetical protein
MSKPVVGRRARVGAAFVALALALALPAAVSADTPNPAPTIFPAASRGATIVVSSAVPVTGKLIATVHVSFTCQPFEIFDWETGQTVLSTEGQLDFTEVEILQVSGRTINYGTGSAFTTDPVVCDGSTVTAFDAPAIAQLLPWKSGSAILGARVNIVSPDFSTSDFASSGALQVKLGK